MRQVVTRLVEQAVTQASSGDHAGPRLERDVLHIAPLPDARPGDGRVRRMTQSRDTSAMKVKGDQVDRARTNMNGQGAELHGREMIAGYINMRLLLPARALHEPRELPACGVAGRPERPLVSQTGSAPPKPGARLAMNETPLRWNCMTLCGTGQT